MQAVIRRSIPSIFTHKVQTTTVRTISTTQYCFGKRNFRKFPLYNKRGSRIFKKQQSENPDPQIPIDKRGVRDTGIIDSSGKFVAVPEMIPELIVPDLTGFKLKPYVSYRVPDVVQSEFTAQNLFDSFYSKKIIEDFNSGKLNEDGSPMEPSEYEKLDAETAKTLARQTGADLFTEDRDKKLEEEKNRG